MTKSDKAIGSEQARSTKTLHEAPIIVYTCIAGLYDRELMPVSEETGLKFVCFSDTPTKINASGWEMRPIRSPSRLSSGHDINRFHKLFAHRLFPTYRWSVYLDGNVRFDGRFADLVARLKLSGHALGAFWHREKHTLLSEVAACKEHKFDRRDSQVIDAQLLQYEMAGLSLDQPIPTNNLLVRDHASDRLPDAMSIWWSHLFEYSKRDQISLLYALKQTGLGWEPLDGRSDEKASINTDLVSTTWHRPPLAKRIERRLRRQFGISLNR